MDFIYFGTENWNLQGGALQSDIKSNLCIRHPGSTCYSERLKICGKIAASQTDIKLRLCDLSTNLPIKYGKSLLNKGRFNDLGFHGPPVGQGPCGFDKGWSIVGK